MVRLERQGDSFVMITGTSHNQKMQNISVLINAISELLRDRPDKNKIEEGIRYLDSSGGIDLRKEIKAALEKATENTGATVSR